MRTAFLRQSLDQPEAGHRCDVCKRWTMEPIVAWVKGVFKTYCRDCIPK